MTAPTIGALVVGLLLRFPTLTSLGWGTRLRANAGKNAENRPVLCDLQGMLASSFLLGLVWIGRCFACPFSLLWFFSPVPDGRRMILLSLFGLRLDYSVFMARTPVPAPNIFACFWRLIWRRVRRHRNQRLRIRPRSRSNAHNCVAGENFTSMSDSAVSRILPSRRLSSPRRPIFFRLCTLPLSSR